MALHPIDGLREDLSQIHKLLLETRILPFAPETRDSYLSTAEHLRDKLERLTQSHLLVGLLGGTGVGKSTLMNALADSIIASTDHRRPHTDRVLIYHHTDESIPMTLTQSKVEWQAVTHKVSGIRHIVLCDLPDFDSLVTKNRALVLEFLEHLDVLVWVSSPEKYADARFYEFLGLVPKAKPNFVFVLNKMDLLFPNDDRSLEEGAVSLHPGQGIAPTVSEASSAGLAAVPLETASAAAGYESLEKLVNRFQDHISRHGIPHPLLFAVSAQVVVARRKSSAWNQFASLRAHLFQQRDVKEIVAIKAANLDEEIQRLLEAVRGEFQVLSRALPVVQGLIEEFSQSAAESIVSGRLALDRWIQQDVRRELERASRTASMLVGPARILDLLLNGWHEWRRVAHALADQDRCGRITATGAFPEGLRSRLRDELQHQQNRLANAFLRSALPPAVTERLVQIMDLEGAWEQFSVRTRNAIENRLCMPYEPAHSWSMLAFQGKQYLAYAALLTVFLVVEGGEGLWMRLIHRPSATTLVNVILSIFNSLFSPSGLAALGTMGVLLALLAARFYRQYKKLLQQQNQKIIDSLKNEAGSHWEGLIRQVIVALTEFQHELQQPPMTFSQAGRKSTGV